MRCPMCGNEVNPDATRCPNCDYSFEQTSKPSTSYGIDKNIVGIIISVIAWIGLICGTIASVMVSSGVGKYGGFSFQTFIVYELAFVISFAMIRGFAEIIFLLQDIRDKE